MTTPGRIGPDDLRQMRERMAVALLRRVWDGASLTLTRREVRAVATLLQGFTRTAAPGRPEEGAAGRHWDIAQDYMVLRPASPRPRGWKGRTETVVAELHHVDERTVRRAVKRYGRAIEAVIRRAKLDRN